MRRVTSVLLLLILGALYAPMLEAQGQLLRNPGMQGNYYSVREGDKPIRLPEGWQVWLAAATGDYLNRSDKVDIQPHPGPGPAPQEGSRAINVDCGFVTCTVAVYQQVGVAAGSNVTASAWSQVKACNLGWRQQLRLGYRIRVTDAHRHRPQWRQQSQRRGRGVVELGAAA